MSTAYVYGNYLGYLIFEVIKCIVWGLICQYINKKKGYSTNWFWWGFFFRIFACLVLACRPVLRNEKGNYQEYVNYPPMNGGYNMPREYLQQAWMPESQVGNGWYCSYCGSFNNNYVGTCSCGKIKTESYI